MGRFKFLTVALLLIQVLTTRASQFVFEPDEHLDSGQQYLAAIRYDSSLENDEENVVGQKENFHVFEDVRGDEEEQQYDYDYESYDDWIDERREEEDENEEEEWEFTGDLPRKRIRRRIIPVGNAIDRDRGVGERSGNGRTQSEWAQAPKNVHVSRQSGPTGSAALFSLYPELAPPEWRETYQNKKRRVKGSQAEVEGKKTKKEQRDTKTREEKLKKNKKQLSDTKDIEGVEKKDTEVLPKVSKNGKKKRLRLSKAMKEEIAMYANEHGVENATTHFREKLDAPLKTVAVEKFLRRYQNRQVRRGDRKENKG